MIFDFIERHKAAFVAVASIVMFGFYLSLTSCIGGASGPVQQEATDVGESEGGVESPLRTQQQTNYIKAYGAEEDAIMRQLAAASWRGSDGTSTLEISPDGSFVETVPSDEGPKERRGQLAVAAVDPMAPELSQDGSASIKQFVCLMENGEYSIFHLTRIQTPDSPSPNPILYLSGSGLAHEGEYTTEHAWESLKVEGVNKELAKSIDGRTDELEKALTAYVKANHSSANTATWDRTLSINYDMGTVRLGFTLTGSVIGADGEPESEYIQITYHIEEKTFEGGEA